MTQASPSRRATRTDDVAVFRRFNRMYTRLIGTLDERLLKTEYNLAEARVLFELANRDEPKAAAIAQELGMDPGYLSRILAKLGRSGLIRRRVSKQDSRASDLSLTRRGRTVFDQLNVLSDQQALAILSRLPRARREQVIRAMETIEGALTTNGRERPPYVLRPHRPGDMGWVVHREGALYAEEFGWDESFEALVAGIVAGFVTHFDARRERCWIAEVDGEAAGHIFLVKHPDQPDTAKLRLLLVEPWARGKGLGQVLVNECIQFARATGYRKMTLWTQSILRAAHRIYEAAGFRLVHEEPHHSFGKDLIGQTWELELVSRE